MLAEESKARRADGGLFGLAEGKRSLKIKLTFSEFCLKIAGKAEKKKKGKERGKMLQTITEAIVA